ncbi:MAG: ABC transporter substrate-binding protein [Acidiferrobacterales bacterium]|nr:ABC transporter substrate-binding protein [Acidiferrobacterales bacterium]
MTMTRNSNGLVAVVMIICVSFLTQTAASADSVKVGFLGGFTGPIETLTPGIEGGAKLAASTIAEQGGLLGGTMIEVVSGDTACVDANQATDSADRLVNSDGVVAIVGALCSGSTIAAANNVAIPAGVVMVSPASTSPAISAMEDNDMVFRTVPSDSFQGESLAKLLLAKGINTVAVTYINNDYGKGFADALSNAYTGMGGAIAASEAHEDGKADYRPEIGALAATGAEHLVVLGYADGAGQTIIRQALESGDFSNFIGGDGMASDSLIQGVGADALEGMIITRAGSPAGEGTDRFAALREAAGMTEVVYDSQAFDAMFMLALAMQQKGSASADGMSAALHAISSPPGMVIHPGDWAQAVEALAAGKEINYEGAGGSVDFNDDGDVSGLIVEISVQDGQLVEVGEIM